MATYDVVPITPALGMLAFVAGTRPLMDVLSPELLDANGKANEDFYAGVHVSLGVVAVVISLNDARCLCACRSWHGRRRARRPLLCTSFNECVDSSFSGPLKQDVYLHPQKLARATQGEAPAAVYERLFSARREDVIRNLEASQAQVREDGLR